MKNQLLAGFLGFFIIGIFYGTGFNKRGLEYFIALTVGSVILSTIHPGLGIIINVLGAYFGYKAAEEYNRDLKADEARHENRY
jgi:hypothetical protein